MLNNPYSARKVHTNRNGETSLYVGRLVEISEGSELSNGAELVSIVWSDPSPDRPGEQDLKGSN